MTTTTPVGETATVIYNLTLCDIGLVQRVLSCLNVITTPVGETAKVIYNITLCDIGLVQRVLSRLNVITITPVGETASYI